MVAEMAATAPATAPVLAVIGGSGLYALHAATPPETLHIKTPFAEAPVAILRYLNPHGSVLFLPRHGADHSIAPHLINYRANIWALHAAGACAVLAVNAVGGISAAMTPGALVLPEQLIDYSWGREHTFCTGAHGLEKHVDFTWPYDRQLIAVLEQAGASLGLPMLTGATYACTQGPRLETAAEVRRLGRDGCDIVGMTGMPEAGLARELGLRYACVALVVNAAAGLGEGEITLQAIEKILGEGMARVRAVLQQALPAVFAAIN